MLKTTIGVIVVRDQHGQSVVGAPQDPYFPIYLGGLTMDGNPIEYSGPGIGVKIWAAQNGLDYEMHQLELDLDSMTVISWKTLN
jgi:hypothetical protein